MANLMTPKLCIELETPGTDEVTEYIVQTDNRDMVAFDLTRSRKDWPAMEDGNVFWINFLAHHALSKRGGVAITFDEFLARAITVTPVDEEGKEAELAAAGSADPFQPEVSPEFS